MGEYWRWFRLDFCEVWFWVCCWGGVKVCGGCIEDVLWNICDGVDVFFCFSDMKYLFLFYYLIKCDGGWVGWCVFSILCVIVKVLFFCCVKVDGVRGFLVLVNI